MKQSEYLLTCLAEECNETALEASKAIRFGIWTIEPNQALRNEERLIAEYRDILAVMELLQELEVVKAFRINKNWVAAKKEKLLANMALHPGGVSVG